MKSYLNDRVVWITGGSRGIGKAIAARLAQAGAKIAICARRKDSLDCALDELRKVAPDAIGIPADVCNSAEVEACAAEIENRLGPVDILINNAGIYRYASLENTSTEMWDSQFAINLKGPFLTTRAVVPGMAQRKEGTIIFISSMVAVQSLPNHSCYAAVKWGLDGFAGCIGQEFVDYGIKVHVIRPGFTDTTIFDEIGGKPNLNVDWIDPGEIADAVEFLLRLPKHAQVPELNYTTTAHRKSY